MSNDVVHTVSRRGLMLVMSSPSGAGKSTITRRLLAEDDNITLSVSATTRPPRPGEVDGKDYHFIDKARYDELVAAHGFLEHAQVFDNYYGTLKAPVEAALTAGRDVLFDIDWQGTQQLAESARDDMVTIFILPPSAEELERRLHTRAQDSDDVIKKRMAKASGEISHYAEYDYVIINEDIDISVRAVATILNAERLRRPRQVGLSGFVSGIQAGL